MIGFVLRLSFGAVFGHGGKPVRVTVSLWAVFLQKFCPLTFSEGTRQKLRGNSGKWQKIDENGGQDIG
jgi:hypothetical protein